MNRREFLKILGVTSMASVTTIKIALPKEKKHIAHIKPKKGASALLLSSEGSEIGWSGMFTLHMTSPPLQESNSSWLVEFEELYFVTDLARKFFQQAYIRRDEITVSMLLKKNSFVYSGSAMITAVSYIPVPDTEPFYSGALIGQSRLMSSSINRD